METVAILNQLQSMGLILSVIDGTRIKVQPKAAITEAARTLIREHKAELVKILSSRQQPCKTKARGYGCNACGCKTYMQVVAWKTTELPEYDPWRYEHRPVVAWRCEGCKTIYEIIGGSRKPIIIH